jgi:hypothetical protein
VTVAGFVSLHFLVLVSVGFFRSSYLLQPGVYVRGRPCHICHWHVCPRKMPHLSHIINHIQGCASVYKVSLRIMHSARRASSSSSSSMINSINPDVSAQREQHNNLLVPLRSLLTAHALRTLKPAPARLPRVLPSALCAASVHAENPGTGMPTHFCLGTCRRWEQNSKKL